MPKRRVRSKYNWPYIKQIYIAGKRDYETGESVDYTYTEIAAIFNIKSEASVKKHADKENWNVGRERIRKKDEESLQRKLEEMKAQELPTIVEMRRTLLKVQLGVVKHGLKQLEAGEMDIKPVDLHRASEFIIKEYYTLFGIPQPQVETGDKAIEIKVGKLDDLYDLANNIRRR